MLLLAVAVGTAGAAPVKKRIHKHSQKQRAKQKKLDPRAKELATALTARDDNAADRSPEIRVVSAPQIREVSAAGVKPPSREALDRVGAPKANHVRVAVAEPTPPAAGRITVEQQSQQLKGVGRVQYTSGAMPPGFVWPATSRMSAVERSCEAELADHRVSFSRADALGKIVDPITSPAMQFGGIAYHSKWDKPPFVVDCQLARMLVHIGPAFARLGITDVTFGSLYRNTLVRFGGKTGTALSRHALGLAMDITSFRTRDGKDHVVKTDYPTGDATLLAVEELVDHDPDFRILLTPKNDPISHADHFHLEASVDFR